MTSFLHHVWQGPLRLLSARQRRRERQALIRQHMVQSLERCQVSPDVAARTHFLIESAHDIDALWHLRALLMHQLSEHCGEREALAQLRDITRLFEGYVAPGMLPSGSPMAAHKR